MIRWRLSRLIELERENVSGNSAGNSRQPVIVVGGPTASGKSALAVGLAEALGGVVINADAMQLYEDLPILCAQPDAAERARAPHRLFGILAADQPGSVGLWRTLAVQAIEEAHESSKPAIVVGGTGLYLRALTQGLDDIPDVPASIRSEFEARYDNIGGKAFKVELANDDPLTAERLAAGDRQRLVRAASVLKATGQPLSAWQTVGEKPSSNEIGARMFVLTPPREALYAACDERFQTMIQRGALDETREFLERGLDTGLPLMKAVGFARTRSTPRRRNHPRRGDRARQPLNPSLCQAPIHLVSTPERAGRGVC